MTTKRKLRAKEVLADIKAGMSNTELMERYSLSGKGLRKVFQKLLEAKALTEAEVDERYSLAEDTGEISMLRDHVRSHVVFSIPVYETGNLSREGWIVDISELGLQVEGLDVAVGEIKSLMIKADEFADIFPFAFDAQCRWVKHVAPHQELRAGFEIVDISDKGAEELLKVMQALTISI